MKKGIDDQELIIKFLAGEADESEMNLLTAWLKADPENRKTFDIELELWQEATFRNKFEIFDTDEGLEKVRSRIGIGQNRGKKVRILSMTNYRLLLAAASVATVLAIFSLFRILNLKNAERLVSHFNSVIETKEGDRAGVRLPDSTFVTMNSGSMLEYGTDFNTDSRNIKFSGEAYFEVATNPQKPFVVNLDKMKISAKGTKFNVFSFGNEDRIEATLVEGHIDVEVSPGNTVPLKSGQQAVYFRRTGNIVVRDVATDTYTSWKENKLRFKDTPLEEVFRRIGRKYNVKFEITNPGLLDLKYTATFIDESIDDVMQMLGAVTPIKYQIINQTSINDKLYTRPKIVVGWAKRKPK